MKLPYILFSLGALMVGYDLAGHACCLLARQSQRGAELWNAHSKLIWPSIPANTGAYDLYWTCFFTVALALMISGYVLKK